MGKTRPFKMVECQGVPQTLTILTQYFHLSRWANFWLVASIISEKIIIMQSFLLSVISSSPELPLFPLDSSLLKSFSPSKNSACSSLMTTPELGSMKALALLFQLYLIVAWVLCSFYTVLIRDGSGIVTLVEELVED